MNRSTAAIIVVFILAAFLQCNESNQLQKEAIVTGNKNNINTIKGLKDYYKKYFPIGVSVVPSNLKGDEGELILQQFNSLTPENSMKIAPIHPEENKYNWVAADSIVAFAQRNGLIVRGHNLCWHNQVPSWMFIESSGKTVTKEILLQRLKDHITAVVSRYKGKIYAWDVVNEAISDKSDEYLRPSRWLQVCGEDYIAKAFEWHMRPIPMLFYFTMITMRSMRANVKKFISW